MAYSVPQNFHGPHQIRPNRCALNIISRLTVISTQIHTEAITYKVSDNVVFLFSLEADVECEMICTVSALSDQKQTIHCSVPIQQSVGFLLQTSVLPKMSWKWKDVQNVQIS